MPAGALFYGVTRRRLDVSFDVALRERVETVAGELHALVAAGVGAGAGSGKGSAICSMVNATAWVATLAAGFAQWKWLPRPISIAKGTKNLTEALNHSQ